MKNKNIKLFFFKLRILIVILYIFLVILAFNDSIFIKYILLENSIKIIIIIVFLYFYNI